MLGKHVQREKMQSYHSLKKIAESDGSVEHEVVVAVALKNLDVLESIVLDITNPDSPNYSNWMTTDEVTNLIKNEEAVQNVTDWLESNNVTITWRSLDSSYLKAVTNISVWESLLHTKFYDWRDTRRNSTHIVRRSAQYSLPHEMTPHITAIFHTCQAPPLITHHAVPKPGSGHNPQPVAGTGLSHSSLSVDPSRMKMRPSMRKEVAVGSNTVTVAFLDQYYYIPFNSGNSMFYPFYPF